MKNAKQINYNGVLPFTIWSGLFIEESPEGDSARLQYFYYSDMEESYICSMAKTQMIKYDLNGNAFVTRYGQKYMLNEFENIR